mmetsp:Transcript_36158/g.70270  ORF Transcript_36158/g.70270 Transcript_36158/m.70270 type:complete len:215 (+) Transcript_36158:171-815(+)
MTPPSPRYNIPQRRLEVLERAVPIPGLVLLMQPWLGAVRVRVGNASWSRVERVAIQGALALTVASHTRVFSIWSKIREAVGIGTGLGLEPMDANRGTEILMLVGVVAPAMRVRHRTRVFWGTILVHESPGGGIGTPSEPGAWDPQPWGTCGASDGRAVAHGTSTQRASSQRASTQWATSVGAAMYRTASLTHPDATIVVHIAHIRGTHGTSDHR